VVDDFPREGLIVALDMEQTRHDLDLMQGDPRRIERHNGLVPLDGEKPPHSLVLTDERRELARGASEDGGFACQHVFLGELIAALVAPELDPTFQGAAISVSCA